MGALKLTWLAGAPVGRSDGHASPKEVLIQEGLRIGRDPKIEVFIDDRKVSRLHAVFKQEGECWSIEKLSLFGDLRVNGLSVKNPPHSGSPVKPGDVIELGDYRLQVVENAPIPVQESETLPVEPSLVEDVPVVEDTFSEPSEPMADADPFMTPHESEHDALSSEPMEQDDGGVPSNEMLQSPEKTGLIYQNRAGLQPRLTFVQGQGNLDFIDLGQDEVSIGRGSQCTIVIEDKKASRKHAQITKTESGYRITDLDSGNGTLVNTIKIKEADLDSGDVIQIGETILQFAWVQTEFETKKDQFLSVPPTLIDLPEAPELPKDFQVPATGIATALPETEAPEEDHKKSLISGFLERFRAMPPRQQVIYAVAIIGALWMTLQEEPNTAPVKIARPKPALVTGDPARKPASALPTFDQLKPQDKAYVEAQYQLALDAFKAKDFDKCIFEIEKIFRIVDQYKQSRDIESLAREQKRIQLADLEEKRRQQADAELQQKITLLLDRAENHMRKGEFSRAEEIFPEIEIYQPENAKVAEWRKIIIEENEKNQREIQERARLKQENDRAWAEFKSAQEYREDKSWHDYIDWLNAIDELSFNDQKLRKKIGAEIVFAENEIKSSRDPWLEKGKSLEEEGKFAEAFEAFKKAADADIDDLESRKAMKRIRVKLVAKAKALVSEGVLSETYGEFESAMKKYQEAMGVAPKDDEYYLKAQSRLKRIQNYQNAIDRNVASDQGGGT